MTIATGAGPLRRRAVTGACLVVVCLLSITLGGCSNPIKGGQSIASARSTVLAIPGVSSAKFTVEGAYNGFQKEWGEDVEIDLKPGFQPKDTAAFVDYIVSTMWSINEHNPDGIGIVLTTTPQVNLDAVGKSAGWTNLKTTADQPSIVVTGSVSLRKQLGEWPGTPPKKTDKTALVQVPVVQPGQ
ncbi:hypothetical protein RCH11_003218 [Glaciihabitans sp. GrIS 2.15]|nr:hypothetical protein [Glaciihabitans sp. GrIS 2.15]